MYFAQSHSRPKTIHREWNEYVFEFYDLKDLQAMAWKAHLSYVEDCPEI